MTSRFQHPSYTGNVAEPERSTLAEQQPVTAPPGIDIRALARAERSCCCAARPVVIALMPPSSGRQQPTDLLLCMHHYRASRQALAAAGAMVADAYGRLLQAPGRQPGVPTAPATLVASR